MATTQTHLSALRTLRKKAGVTDLAAEPEKTIAAMDAHYKFSSTRVCLSALRKEYPDCQVWIDEMRKRRPQWDTLDNSQTMTETQEKKFLTWDQIIEFRDSHYDEFSTEDRLLINLYTRMPPVRADFTPMRIVNRKPTKLEDGINYLIWNSKPRFLFHAYKTHASMGDREVEIPKVLVTEIAGYLAGRTDGYLFQHAVGKAWSDTTMSKRVISVFNKHLDIDTGIQMIRHAWVTKQHEGLPTIAELKEKAVALLHSVTTQQQYRLIHPAPSAPSPSPSPTPP